MNTHEKFDVNAFLLEDDAQIENMNAINPTGTQACVFKVGSKFYDYTPFKVAAGTWTAYWQQDPDGPEDPFGSFFNFGWCQTLTESGVDVEGNPPKCPGDFYTSAYPYLDDT